MQGKSIVKASVKLPTVSPKVTERCELFDNPVERRQEIDETEDQVVFSVDDARIRALLLL